MRYWTNAVWTTQVKAAICDACRPTDQSNEVYLYAQDVPNADAGEWLFDVTCLHYDDEGYLLRVPLIAECEWGNEDEIADDFQKLIVSGADVRVMVFDGTYWNSSDSAFRFLCAYLAAFEGVEVDADYLLAAWTSEGFQYRCVVPRKPAA